MTPGPKASNRRFADHKQTCRIRPVPDHASPFAFCIREQAYFPAGDLPLKQEKWG